MKSIRSRIAALSSFCLLFVGLAPLSGQTPTVSGVTASQVDGTKEVAITYDLSISRGGTADISVKASKDGGENFEAIPAASLSGAVGAGQSAGTSKSITWDAGDMGWDARLYDLAQVEVIATTSGGANIPPVADAGDDIIEKESGTEGYAFVSIHGSASTDVGRTIVSWQWEPDAAYLNGSGAYLDIYNQTGGFAGAGDFIQGAFPVGTTVVTLTVTDDMGATAQDTVSITVLENEPPVAVLGDDITLIDIDGDGIHEYLLDSRDSYDPDTTTNLFNGIGEVVWHLDNVEVSNYSTAYVHLPLGENQLMLTVWDYSGEATTATKTVTVVAYQPPVSAGEFSLIPEGTFFDGAEIAAGIEGTSEHVDAFYIQRNEVTRLQWDDVATWASQNDYDIGPGSVSSKGPHHPVYDVSWYECVKWCNAWSERDGFVPVYTIDGIVYKSGEAIPNIDVSATGYRLPTAPEWEKAARDGLNGKRFPWGDTISHVNANYNSRLNYQSYDLSRGAGYHPDYDGGEDSSSSNLYPMPYTSPFGSFPPTQNHSLYDVVGNLFEWCNSTDEADNGRRVYKGGAWNNLSPLRIDYSLSPARETFSIGFRTAYSVERLNDRPTADASNDITVTDSDDNGFETVTLDASGSSDPEGPIDSYKWSWSGSSVYGETVQQAFPVGTTTVTLEVTDEDGATDSDTVTVTVEDGGGEVLEGFEYIPAGSFEMGDSFGEGDSDELPVHTVYVSDYYIARTEVTYGQWQEVYDWAIVNDYLFTGYEYAEVFGKSTEHPVCGVIWDFAILWCNAASERDGLDPVYRTQSGDVYRQRGYEVPVIDYSRDGYRLPSEAEWEKAARSGNTGMRFPLGDTISYDEANYNASEPGPDYDLSSGRHPDYYEGDSPYTAPVGSFPASGGLYDMAGNVWEWCNDVYDADYYASFNGATAVDPHGPEAGSVYNERVVRGGFWSYGPDYSRVAKRVFNSPGFQLDGIGFRLARSSGN